MQPEDYSPTTTIWIRFCLTTWGSGRWLSSETLLARDMGKEAVPMVALICSRLLGRREPVGKKCG